MSGPAVERTVSFPLTTFGESTSNNSSLSVTQRRKPITEWLPDGYSHPLQTREREFDPLRTRDILYDSSSERKVTRKPKKCRTPASMKSLEDIDFAHTVKPFERTLTFDPLNPNYPRLSDGIGLLDDNEETIHASTQRYGITCSKRSLSSLDRKMLSEKKRIFEDTIREREEKEKETADNRRAKVEAERSLRAQEKNRTLGATDYLLNSGVRSSTATGIAGERQSNNKRVQYVIDPLLVSPSQRMRMKEGVGVRGIFHGIALRAKNGNPEQIAQRNAEQEERSYCPPVNVRSNKFRVTQTSPAPQIENSAFSTQTDGMKLDSNTEFAQTTPQHSHVALKEKTTEGGEYYLSPSVFASSTRHRFVTTAIGSSSEAESDGDLVPESLTHTLTLPSVTLTRSPARMLPKDSIKNREKKREYEISQNEERYGGSGLAERGDEEAAEFVPSVNVVVDDESLWSVKPKEGVKVVPPPPSGQHGALFEQERISEEEADDAFAWTMERDFPKWSRQEIEVGEIIDEETEGNSWNETKRRKKVKAGEGRVGYSTTHPLHNSFFTATASPSLPTSSPPSLTQRTSTMQPSTLSSTSSFSTPIQPPTDQFVTMNAVSYPSREGLERMLSVSPDCADSYTKPLPQSARLEGTAQLNSSSCDNSTSSSAGTSESYVSSSSVNKTRTIKKPVYGAYTLHIPPQPDLFHYKEPYSRNVFMLGASAREEAELKAKEERRRQIRGEVLHGTSDESTKQTAFIDRDYKRKHPERVKELVADPSINAGANGSSGNMAERGFEAGQYPTTTSQMLNTGSDPSTATGSFSSSLGFMRKKTLRQNTITPDASTSQSKWGSSSLFPLPRLPPFVTNKQGPSKTLESSLLQTHDVPFQDL